MVILTGFHAGNLLHFLLHDYQGILMGFQDGDEVMDGLPDGFADKSDDVWMDRNFPQIQTFRKFHTAILVGIFTMNLADGWTDRAYNGHTDGQMEFQVESCLG